MQALIDFLVGVFHDFTWKRLLGIVFLLMFVALAVLIYGAQTGTVELSKYERAISILERLDHVEVSGKQEEAIVSNILDGLVEITQLSKNSWIDNFSLSLRGSNAMLAASPWLLLAAFFLVSVLRGKNDSGAGFFGSFVFAIGMGIGGYFIPIDWPRWIFPVLVNLALLIALIWYGNRTKAA